MTSFVDAHPVASLVELADVLSVDEHDVNCADVAADHLAQVWREEAKAEGPAPMERMARRLLVGELRSKLPEGWASAWHGSDDADSALSRFVSAGTSWRRNVGAELAANAARVLQAMVEAGRAGMIPAGWTPASTDDPLLRKIFDESWLAA